MKAYQDAAIQRIQNTIALMNMKQVSVYILAKKKKKENKDKIIVLINL